MTSPEAYVIPNQETSTAAGALINNFCRFWTPRELHGDQAHKFEPCLIQEALQLLGVNKTRTTLLHPQSDGLYERFIKNGRRSTYGKSSDRTSRIVTQDFPSPCLQGIQSGHNGVRPASLVFGRELRLPCDCSLEHPPTRNDPQSIMRKIQWTIYKACTIMHTNTWSRLVIGWKRVMTECPTAVYQEGDDVWLCWPTRTKVEAPKLQSSWDGPKRVVTRINDVLYRIQRNPRSSMMVVHLDRMAPYQETSRDEWS
jgi:hypothetical protein